MSRHTVVCDPELMISDPGENAWPKEQSRPGDADKANQAYYRHLQKALVKYFHIDENVPFSDLQSDFDKRFYFGTNGTPIEMSFSITEKRKLRNLSKDSCADAAAL